MSSSKNNYLGQFDFVLASGVWHHLSQEEQIYALFTISELLKPKGYFAITLRNGPAGAGTHVFPTHVERTIKTAELCNLTVQFRVENQPSLLPNKEAVTWGKLVFQKI